MSYDVLILAIVAIVAVFFAYRQGLKDRQQVDDRKPLEPIVHVPKGTPKPSNEDLRKAVILSNLDSFDGTPKGQREVKT